MKYLIKLQDYGLHSFLILLLSGLCLTNLYAQTRSSTSPLLNSAEQAWHNFTIGNEQQPPEVYEKAVEHITTLVSGGDELSLNEAQLWQSKALLLKVYAVWLRDIIQQQWIVPPSQKKVVYQDLLTQLSQQTHIKILRSQNLLMQSLIHYALRDFTYAETLCKEALALESQNPYFLQRLAKVYTQQEKYEEAEHYLNQSLRYDPNNEEALGKLSYVYLQTYREEEALALINKALELAPDYPRNLIVLAILLADKGQIEESQLLYAKIRNLQPYYTFAYTNDASNFIKQKNYHKAAELLEVLLQKNPYCSKAWSLQGDVYSDQEMYQEALENYEKCNEIDNSCLTDMAYLYYKKNDYQKALSYYQQAIVLDSTNKNAHHWAGWCYLLTNQYKKALLSFETVIQLDSLYAYAFNGLATTYELLDDYPQAIAMYEKAIAANPYQNNNSATQLGKLCAIIAEDYSSKNQYIQAIEYLRVGGKYQAHCQALATGLSYQEGLGLTQDYTQAYQHYQKASERHPYTFQAASYIVNLYEKQQVTMDSLDYKVWETVVSTKYIRLQVPIQSETTTSKNTYIFLYDAYPAQVQPLEWEVQRLKDELNATLSQDVFDALTKLYDLAKKNNVSYTQLVKYALELANEK